MTAAPVGLRQYRSNEEVDPAASVKTVIILLMVTCPAIRGREISSAAVVTRGTTSQDRRAPSGKRFSICIARGIAMNKERMDAIRGGWSKQALIYW